MLDPACCYVAVLSARLGSTADSRSCDSLRCLFVLLDIISTFPCFQQSLVLIAAEVSKKFGFFLGHFLCSRIHRNAWFAVDTRFTIAKLRMSVYGTKAAAQNWQQKVQETMATLGFSIGKASPVLSSSKKFEMSRARRRLRCVRRTSRSGLDEKRVGVEVGNQYYNTWRRTRNVEGGEDIE